MYDTIKTPFTIDEAQRMWTQSKEEMGFHNLEFKGTKFHGSISWHADYSTQISFWIKTVLITKKNGTTKFPIGRDLAAAGRGATG
jgi:hypothetical protein